MKLIKTFALFTFLFVATSITAQNSTAKWPAMKSYEEVVTRINNGVSQGNDKVIAGFAQTLQHFSNELTSKPTPAEFRTKKIKDAITKLQTQTTALSEKAAANADDPNLKPMFLDVFSQYRAVSNLVQNSN